MNLFGLFINKPGINHEFEETIKELWRYAQLNLLDVFVDREGIYTPSFIVLEPDYLIDISSLAECYKDYGSHPVKLLFKPVGSD